MNSNRLLSILGLTLSFLAIGCDKVCKKNVENVVTIQNMTGRAFALNVCKGGFGGEKTLSIPENTEQNEISLGVQESHVIRGGFADVCSGVQDEKATDIGISLSPSSFSQVKLCFDEAKKRYLLIETSQSCPSNFLEQTSNDPCATSPSER